MRLPPSKTGRPAQSLALAVFVMLISQALYGQQTSPPRALYSPDPEYSEQARMQHLEGSCLLRATVDSYGAVHHIEVERPLGGGLDQKAIEALKHWRFEPARKDGHPVAAEIHVEMTFRLHFSELEQEEFRTRLRDALPPPVEVPVSTTIEPCPSRVHEIVQSPSTVAVAELTFDGALQLPVEEQNQIVASIKRNEFTGTPETVTDVVLELVRAGWQDRGYFKAQVSGEPKLLTTSPASSRIAIVVHVDEGEQYRLSGIDFRGNKTLTNKTALRDLFPIKDGEITSREKIAQGLATLNKAYEVQGFINATFVPEPYHDDQEPFVAFVIDVDEGKQFYISSINLIGESEAALAAANEVLALKVGQQYNQNLVDLFLAKHAPTVFDDSTTDRHFDLNKGTVDITFDVRQCQSK